MSHPIAPYFGSWIVVVSMFSIAQAANDVWDGNGVIPPNGNGDTGVNWVDDSTSGNTDSATFNSPQR